MFLRQLAEALVEVTFEGKQDTAALLLLYKQYTACVSCKACSVTFISLLSCSTEVSWSRLQVRLI